jgi:NAD(P)-dependent dehydrogenase (short-subunit alcohol dehydrogenase family)
VAATPTRFDRRVAVVTGGGRGMGRAVSVRLAGEGARVVVAELVPEHGEEVAEQITKAGGEALAVPTDVSKLGDIDRLFATVESKWGGCDILVNNAGIGVGKPAVEYTEADWDRQMGVNVKAMFFCSQAAVCQMLPKGRGKIVNFASVSSFVSSSKPGVAYDVSKGAVRMMTIAMAAEFAPLGININAVAPGTVETEMSRQSLSTEEGRAWQLARIPMGRIGKPEDIAGVVAFLCSSEADYITGHVLVADGGWTLF